MSQLSVLFAYDDDDNDNESDIEEGSSDDNAELASQGTLMLYMNKIVLFFLCVY